MELFMITYALGDLGPGEGSRVGRLLMGSHWGRARRAEEREEVRWLGERGRETHDELPCSSASWE